jgi:hypothetical protein
MERGLFQLEFVSEDGAALPIPRQAANVSDFAGKSGTEAASMALEYFKDAVETLPGAREVRNLSLMLP